jgi:BTB/POZ domain
MAATDCLDTMRLLMLSDKYSDLKIVCGGREIHVHRAVMCLHSPFFDAACGGNFKERRAGYIR